MGYWGIATGVIHSGHIQDGGVCADDLANGAVTGDKIASQAVSDAKIALNAVTSGHIQSDAILADHIAAGQIVDSHIDTGSYSFWWPPNQNHYFDSDVCVDGCLLAHGAAVFHGTINGYGSVDLSAGCGFVLPSYGPSSCGSMYFDSCNGNVKVYDGSQWRTLTWS